jgi:phospholipid/cholesterol/gamma-HCH transport system substrate-binding protein
MDSKVNYALIGLFIIILSIALVASILWLSIGGNNKHYRTYQVYIQESVSGLKRKAPVKYRGVQVGYVRDIALMPNRPNEVRVLLDIEQNVPIKQDSLALLSIQGLTGLAHVELTGGSRDSLAPVRQIGQDYPEIKSGPSLLVRLDTAVSSLLKNMNSISGSANTLLSNIDLNIGNNILGNIGNLSQALNVLLSQQNTTAVTNIIHNVELVSSTVAARTDTIDKGLDNFAEATDNMNKISGKFISLIEQLENSIVSVEDSSRAFARIASAIEKTSNAFTKTMDKVNNTVVAAEGTTKAIGKTAEDISIAVNESHQDMNYFTRQALPEVTNSLRELRRLLKSLRNFSQELERKPNMLLFGK